MKILRPVMVTVEGGKGMKIEINFEEAQGHCRITIKTNTDPSINYGYYITKEKISNFVSFNVAGEVIGDYTMMGIKGVLKKLLSVVNPEDLFTHIE